MCDFRERMKAWMFKPKFVNLHLHLSESGFARLFKICEFVSSHPLCQNAAREDLKEIQNGRFDKGLFDHGV